MLSRARAAVRQGAEAVEFRIDSLAAPSLEEILMLAQIDAQTIVTFKGDSVSMLSDGGIRDVLSAFDFIDLDEADVKRLDVAPDISGRLILSHHGHIGSLSSASAIIAGGLAGAGTVKCINSGGGYAGSMLPLKAAEIAGADSHRVIAFSMGEEGKLSRIASMRRGAPVSYASTSESDITAPGQLTVKEMLAARNGFVLGIVGSAEATVHSLSPSIHRALLDESGIRGVYLRFPVNAGELPHFFDCARYAGAVGFNVTMPFKEEALALSDRADPVAEAIGAVNTIVGIDGEFVGYNTDETAFSEVLGGMKPETALLFGSGGAARAAAYSLRGCRVSIAARNKEKRKAIARDFGLEEYDGSRQDFDLLVNCTPAGMSGNSVVIPGTLRECGYRLVVDFVYPESGTPFREIALAQSSGYVGGIELLARQAVHSFRLWTGRSTSPEFVLTVLGGESGNEIRG